MIQYCFNFRGKLELGNVTSIVKLMELVLVNSLEMWRVEFVKQLRILLL